MASEYGLGLYIFTGCTHGFQTRWDNTKDLIPERRHFIPSCGVGGGGKIQYFAFHGLKNPHKSYRNEIKLIYYGPKVNPSKYMSITTKDSENIKEYWNHRALAAKKSPTATTDDIFLRELEIKTFVKRIGEINLKDDSVVVDVGCGDGYSTLRIAALFPHLKFVGIDYSEEMINTARKRLAEAEIPENQIVEFHVGDATTLNDIVPPNSANVVMTDRCLINLASPDAQYDAIAQISDILCKNGCYLAIENFNEGQAELNNTRAAIGLNEIPVRWHNLFFHEDEFLTRAKPHFKSVEIDNFSSAYYYATRVIYSKECQLNGTKPDYHHLIHQLAVDLPSMGSCSPIKLAVLVK